MPAVTVMHQGVAHTFGDVAAAKAFMAQSGHAGAKTNGVPRAPYPSDRRQAQESLASSWGDEANGVCNRCLGKKVYRWTRHFDGQIVTAEGDCYRCGATGIAPGFEGSAFARKPNGLGRAWEQGDVPRPLPKAELTYTSIPRKAGVTKSKGLRRGEATRNLLS